MVTWMLLLFESLNGLISLAKLTKILLGKLV